MGGSASHRLADTRHRTQGVHPTPDLNAAITAAAATFVTHDDDKDDDTTVDVYIDNKIGLFLSVEVASNAGAFKDKTLRDDPTSVADLQLDVTSTSLTLRQIQVPVWRVKMHPTGNDRWIFDVDVKLLFGDGTMIHGATSGVILDQNNSEVTGVMGL